MKFFDTYGFKKYITEKDFIPYDLKRPRTICQRYFLGKTISYTAFLMKLPCGRPQNFKHGSRVDRDNSLMPFLLILPII